MIEIDREGAWLVSLDDKLKERFLAALGHGLTIAGRNSYTVQEEKLDKPALLRQVNEIQHRVLACLHQLLVGTSNADFLRSIANWVLQQTDKELEGIMILAWNNAKERIR